MLDQWEMPWTPHGFVSIVVHNLVVEVRGG